MGALDDRDELLADVAEARQIVDDEGLRRHRVYLRTRRWYTGTAAPWTPSGARGRGSPVDVETAITPAPRVRNVSTHEVLGSGGRFQAGDFRVDKITPRLDPYVGIEFTDLMRPTTHPDEERHVILVGMSGTPWHVREGTARLLVAAPVDEASAVVCANALRGAYPGHWSDAYAHIAPSASPAPGTAATAWASALTLANALRASWAAHRADLGAHPEADPYALAAPVATDPQSTLVLLHDLLRAFNAHAAPGPVMECEAVAGNADLSFTHALTVRPTRRTP